MCCQCMITAFARVYIRTYCHYGSSLGKTVSIRTLLEVRKSSHRYSQPNNSFQLLFISVFSLQNRTCRNFFERKLPSFSLGLILNSENGLVGEVRSSPREFQDH